MFLSERILNIAPATAAYFRLKTEFSDGSTKFFPADERSYFVLGDSPFGVAAGVYVLCFYDKHYQALPAFDRSFEMKLESDLHRADQSHLFLHANQAVTPVANGVGESRFNNTPTPGKSLTDTHKAEPRNEEGMTAVANLEFQRHMHAMDLEERQQEFIKNSTYLTEVGELFTLNRIMRRELVEMQRLIVQHSQQAYRDIEHVKGISRDFLQLQKEILASAAENIARPATPPPDHVGLGHSALSLIKEIGIALISRSSAPNLGRILHSGMQVPQQLPPTLEPSLQRSDQAADVLDRVAQKLRGSSDLDIAVAMSSPEKWKALFDDLSAVGRETSGSAGVPTSASREVVGTST